MSTSDIDEIISIWNKVYPVQMIYSSVQQFEDYLNQFSDKHHHCIYENDTLVAWAVDFIRDDERWFVMLVDDTHQGSGLGEKLISSLQEKNDELNGWVVDHNRYRRSNGESFISPLRFYLKNMFRLQIDRMETSHLSLVKVKWIKQK